MMRGGFSDTLENDSFQHYNLNQAGLDEAEQNYFLKYATSGFSDNTQRISKRIQTKVIQPDPTAFSKIKNTQNEVLRELKQQYEILRNLPIDDKIHIKSKAKQRQPTSQYSSSIDDRSEITSSKQSRTKKVSRDAEILAIQKKQLQIVISNSLKKIQELLQNQMELKKTIHELKLQIQGKGGINSEYQLQIRSLKKTQKQLRENIEALKSEIQKKNFTIKQLGEKNAFLEGQKSRRDQEHKSFYDSQRQIEDLLRKQKDRCMNAQLQIKRVQMEFQIYQKDKTAQINRLTRQLDQKLLVPERDAETIRHLQDQIKTKDLKIQSLVEQVETLRAQIIRPVSPPPPPAQDPNKKIFEELIKQMKSKSQSETKDTNEAIVKALVDKLSSRKDESLKNQLSTIRLQMQNIKKGSNVSEVNPFQENQLRGRIRELQRIIEEQKREKKSLLEDIQNLKAKREELYAECEQHKRKVREHKNAQQKLLGEIEQLGNFMIQFEESKMENQEIKGKLQNILNPKNVIHIRKNPEDQSSNENYEEEVRMLRRRVDELTFNLNKVTEQKTLHESLFRQSQDKELLRLNEDISRYRQLLKNSEEQISILTEKYKTEIQVKNETIADLNKRFDQLNKMNKQSIESSRINYEQLLKVEVKKHYSQLQSMNQKILQLTKTNENLLSRAVYFSALQKQVQELRRLTRNQKRTNEAIDHLWDIKEVEYGNISEILSSVRN